MARNITITKAQNSRIGSFDFNNIGFGKIFSDHMFVADWDGQNWVDARIEPYGNMWLSPATSAIHYGQSIFEGMKAFQNNGGVTLFRPLDNWKRLNISADRMVMPEIPQDLFMEGLMRLVDIDRQWVPSDSQGSMYIRPFMFATDDFVGVRPSEKYRFAIFTCPVGPYYSKPLKIKVEEKYSRAAQGGVGFTKCAGNYGGAMYPTKLAQAEGYDQVLWTDPATHTMVEETGTTNIFAVFRDTVVTPNLHDTMLAGITRDSVAQVLRNMGKQVEERPLSVSELREKASSGELREMFITGTAATMISIEGFAHHGQYFDIMASGDGSLSAEVKKTLDGIRFGQTEDPYGWTMTVPVFQESTNQ